VIFRILGELGNNPAGSVYRDECHLFYHLTAAVGQLSPVGAIT